MYNRYVPQPDGSYRRNRMQETHPETEQKPPVHSTIAPPPPPREPEPSICNGCIHRIPPRKQIPAAVVNERHSYGIPSFLKRLLPKEFDVEDLLVILLLMLISGDCQEDQNTALLTLVLYLFL